MKRSLFKKPAWSSSGPITPKDDKEDLFRRSGTTYVDIVAEKKRRKEEKEAKKERERLEKEAEEESRVKRRKTSESDGLGVGGEDHTRRSTSLPRGSEIEGQRIERGSDEPDSSHKSLPHSRSESGGLRSTHATTTTVTRMENNIIDLEDPDELQIVAVTTSEPVQVEEEDEDSEEDEQFRVLKRKAREKARLQKLGLYQPSSTPDSKSNSQQSPSQSDGSPSYGPSQPLPLPPPPDPVLQIFITSPLPDTKALIVQRKLSQPLREVRKAYCDKQQLLPEVADTTFLVWNGSRLFDVTSCKSLGFRVEADGTILDGRGGLGSLEGSLVEMELFTPELFEAHRQQRARHLSADLEHEDQPEEANKEDAEPNLKIIMKSKGLEEVRMTVKPSTAVSRMIGVFRQQRNIGEEKDVTLVFDGDRLNPQSSVADNDLADMDNIDVHIK
jgi:hypothetical protein